VQHHDLILPKGKKVATFFVRWEKGAEGEEEPGEESKLPIDPMRLR